MRSGCRPGRLRRTSVGARDRAVHHPRISCPARRRSTIGTGLSTVQSVRRTNDRTSRNSRTTTIANAAGRCLSVTNCFEPKPTTVQNVSTIDAPASSPPGTTALDFRSPSCQVTGSVHRSLVIGPVGPLKAPDCRSPQCPSKFTQASGSSAESTESGRRTTSGSSIVEGPSVLSQPNPSVPRRPR